MLDMSVKSRPPNWCRFITEVTLFKRCIFLSRAQLGVLSRVSKMTRGSKRLQMSPLTLSSAEDIKSFCTYNESFEVSFDTVPNFKVIDIIHYKIMSHL